MRMHVTGRDGRNAQHLCELLQLRVAACVTTFIRTLQLDVERTCERTCEPRGSVRIYDAEAVPRAARECDEPLGVLLEHLDARLGGQQVALFPRHARPQIG